ncbi:MAG: Uma2 family endonuclease [Acidobacteria bacterium]|nr:Uma2 family endonuclease [Acidobacteriota bacterium]
MASKTIMTVEQLDQLPVGNTYELDEGELVVKPRSRRRHERVKTNIVVCLAPYARRHKAGEVFCETEFILHDEPATMRRPDVSFVTSDRLAEPDETLKAPDLCIEVASSESAEELNRKINQYFAFQALAVWVAYPESETVHVYTSPTQVRILTAADTLEMPDLLPGFSAPVTEFFAQ